MFSLYPPQQGLYFLVICHINVQVQKTHVKWLLKQVLSKPYSNIELMNGMLLSNLYKLNICLHCCKILKQRCQNFI